MSEISNNNEKTNEKFEKTINSNIYEVKLLITNALRFIDQLGEYSDEKRNDIRLVLSELLINALYHGNKNDSIRKIRLRITPAQNQQILVEVEDEGKGLNRKVLKNKKRSGEIKKTSLDENGRGLMLISELTNRLFTTREGKKVCTLISIKDQETKL